MSAGLRAATMAVREFPPAPRERSKGQYQYKPEVQFGATIDTNDTYLNFLEATM